jgi:two-component system, NtrC family, sensor kinase
MHVNQKVLVVDDDERFGKSVAEMLRFLDFDPTVCTTAQQALNLTRNCQFRLIFSDIRMPGINGFEFYRFLAAVDESLPKRVIFITGDLGNPETRQMVAKTQVVCIEKPVTFDVLEAAIAKVLDRMDRPETSSAATPPLLPASRASAATTRSEATNAERALIGLESV